MPSRPSGAGKKQKAAKNQGSSGLSLEGSPVDRADFATIRHAVLKSEGRGFG
jgi:hypothetical protein